MGIGSYIRSKGVPGAIQSGIKKYNPKATSEGIQTAAEKLFPAIDKAALKMGGIGAVAGLAVSKLAGNDDNTLEDVTIGAGTAMAVHTFTKNKHAPSFFHTSVHATQLGAKEEDKIAKGGKPRNPNKTKPDQRKKKNSGKKEPYKAKAEVAKEIEEMRKTEAAKAAEKIIGSDHIQSFMAGKYRGKAALVGAALGLVKTMGDTDDDDIFSTVGNAAVGAGLAYGAARGAEAMTNDKDAQKAIDQGLKDANKKVTASKIGRELDKDASEKDMYKELTAQDLQKIKQEAEAKKTLDKQSFIKKAKNIKGKAGMIAAIGAAAIGVASVMDTSNDLKHKTREGRMVAYEEENLQRRKQQRDNDAKKAGYGHVDWGQLPIDMFNERIGHYKMGNSKFQ
jgi:hypothetical protein